MISFIAKLSEFFRMTRNIPNADNFDNDIMQYVIPKYQREYKWTEDRVKTFITDINNRDKFLGNIILDKKGNSYEIVDGQQRITTVFLTLIALFNQLRDPSYQNINLEQDNILHYILKDQNYILKNQSIGDFLHLNNNSINFNINEENDVYYQKDTFLHLFDIITFCISEIDTVNFVRKLLNCSFLILISDNPDNNPSIEQVFLDINFKSQLLDVEDIFKGYCFKNYWPQFHEELKNQWVILKQNSRTFIDFGYKDMNEFLYHYLLSKPDSYDIPQKLNPDGNHYLEGKNNNETQQILNEMVIYSQNITNFRNRLYNANYTFLDLCPDLNNYRNAQEYLIMKRMCISIIENKAAQYHKFPFFMIINYFMRDVALGQGITRFEFKKLITNYYIYSFLFINDNKRKQKKSIDHSIFNILYDNNPEKQRRIVASIKILRNDLLNGFTISKVFSLENAYALFSIIDYYISADNFLPKIYSLENNFNREHLIIHDNRTQKVSWLDGTNSFDFDLNVISNSNIYKRSTINYIIMNEQINASLGHNDIVWKISKIEQEYVGNMPKHIFIFVDHIKSMDSFNNLQLIKQLNTSHQDIVDKYHEFVNSYFSELNQEILLAKIQNEFKNSFHNN